MSKQKPNPTESQLGRRRFLRRSVVSGLGAGLVLNAPGTSAASVPAECEPSASDSLLLYIDLLGRIQSEAFSAAAGAITSAAKDCYGTLDSLYLKIELLMVELKGRRVRAHAEQMRNAVQFGKAQIELIRTLPANGQKTWAALGATIAVVGTQVDRGAQDLLPSGRIVLTPKAKELLEEIMILVRDFRAVPESTKRATDAHQDRVNEISRLTNEIRDLLFAASSDAADADLSANPALAQQAKLRAAKNIDDACTKLEQLRVPANTARRSELTSVDLLVKVLQGTKPSVGALSAQLRRDGQMQFVPTSFGASAAVPDSMYSRVQQVLNAHCPYGTPWRTLHCASLILGPRAYADVNTRIPLIAGVLVLFRCSGGDKAALARALARL
jgi:hypothetical protein